MIAAKPGTDSALIRSRPRKLIAALIEHPFGRRIEVVDQQVRAVLLTAEIARVRVQGYSVIDQEVEMGLCSMAVPLVNARGQVIAALNLGRAAGPEPMADVAQRLLPELQAVAAQLRGLLR